MMARCLLIAAVFGITHIGYTATAPEYLRQIKPILREHCFTCHGSLQQEAGLRLDTVASMVRGGESGAAIVPGHAAKSILIDRIAATDSAVRMPPEHEGGPLAIEQVNLLRAWIELGAPAPDDELPDPDPREHWAFRPIRRPPPLSEGLSAWGRNPLDTFIAARHRQLGLRPQPEAPRAVLLRRLYIDLIGLPPSAEEIAEMERDPSTGWYHRVVNRLLNDPRHGERWGRHWMDIWRYSDWWGLGEQLRNSQHHIWHWRDWIVESLNADVPYDEMVRMMLAADELYPDDLDRLRATGFLARNYFLFNRHQWMDETIEHVSKGFLGLTMNCAKCHSHKYDPIEQKDYYRMRAFFEPYHVRLDVVPGEPDLGRDGIPRVYDGLLDTPTYCFVRGQENSPDKSAIIAPDVPELLKFQELEIVPVALPVAAWQPERHPWVIQAHRNAAARKTALSAAAVKEVEEKLGAAKRQVAEQTDPSVKVPSETAVADAELAFAVARLALEVAERENDSVNQRANAMHSQWIGAEVDGGLPAAAPAVEINEPRDTKYVERNPARQAVRAERELAVAKAKHSVAEIELRSHRAVSDQQPAIEKELATARENLDKAIKQVDEPGTEFTKFIGAAWTPTRFLNSTADDPMVTFPSTSTGRRTALADWITDNRHPLTARVAANHIWLRHMGVPLVPTVFDFGRKGTPPVHHELLDWLASELIASGWSMKHMHRLIVTSAVYRLSSSTAGAEISMSQDPENRYWWRRVPIRLESEVVRDSILSLAGTLDLRFGGPPVLPPDQVGSTRRSLYFFHSNNDRNLFLTTFDEAMVKECYRREQSIVPQQALAMTNSRLVLDASVPIAGRLSGHVGTGQQATADNVEFMRRAFKVILGNQASDSEVAACLDAIKQWREQPGASSETVRPNLVWALLNHNDFVTLR
jgi:hypothetical protein